LFGGCGFFSSETTSYVMKRETARLKPYSNNILKGLENKHECAPFSICGSESVQSLTLPCYENILNR